MPYYKEINTLFLHIPKTGGTSLEEYLKCKCTQTLYSYSLDKRENIMFEKYKIDTVSLQHLTYKEIYQYKEILDVNFNENLKIITVVRNPYDRIISGLFFNDLINENSTPPEVYEVIQKYIYQDCHNHDNHNKPQYEFLIDNDNSIIPNIDIFKTETLTPDLRKYGYDDFDLNFNRNKINIEKDKYAIYLNNDSIKLINEFYKKDFELFSYDMKICV
jgi:hypothetical protein